MATELSTNNVIQYAKGDGNDTIEGFTADDTLYITEGNISSSVISGDNLILKIDSGKITLKDVKDSSFQLKLPNGNVSTFSVTKGGGTSASETIKGDVSVDGVTVNGGVVNVDSKFDGFKVDLEDYSLANNVNASDFKEILEVVGDNKNNSLTTGSGDDIISGGAGKDTLTGGAGNDVFVHTEGTDIITDYVENEDVIQLGEEVEFTGARLSGNDVILSTSEGSITLKKGKDKNICVVDAEGNEKIYKPASLSSGLSYDGTSQSAVYADISYKTIRSSAALNNSNHTTLTVGKSFTGKTIELDNYASTVKVVNATSVTKGISIVGNRLNNSLVGGKKNDTLAGGKGNDTLTGGKGNDVFVHTKGKDVITDYTAGTDSIQLGEGVKISGSKVSSKNVILKTSASQITVKNAKNKKITVIDSEGNTTTKIYPLDKMTNLSYSEKKDILTVGKSFAGETIDLTDYAKTVKTVNAKNASVNVDLVGNDLNNSLVGGKGNDTLAGGDGKDTLTGGKGKDVFVYTSGNDVITDYASDVDSIQLGAGVKVRNWEVSKKDVIFTTSTGKFTVKNGKGKKITLVDENGDKLTKKYSTSSSSDISHLWLAEVNDISSSDNLNSILTDNITSADYKIETSNFDTLNQKDFMLTFAKTEF